MIKQKVVLAPNTFYEWYHVPNRFEAGYRKKMALRALIDQHKIVLSHNLMDQYLEAFVDEEERKDVEISFEKIAYQESSDVEYEYVHDDCEQGFSIEEILLDIARKDTDFIIVCDTKEQYSFISERTDNYLKKKDEILYYGYGNKLYRNSVVFSKDMRPRENADEFLFWLREAFSGEKEISILDSYFLTPNGFETFVDYYLDCVPNGSHVHVYSKYNKKDKDKNGNEKSIRQEKWDELLTVKNNRRITVSFHLVVSKQNDFHDRRIYLHTSEKHIAIGRGIACIRKTNSGRVIMRDTHITVDDDMSYLSYFIDSNTCVDVPQGITVVDDYYKWGSEFESKKR